MPNYPIKQGMSDNFPWQINHLYTFLTYIIMQVNLGKHRKESETSYINGSEMMLWVFPETKTEVDFLLL